MKFDSSIIDFIKKKTKIDIFDKSKKWNINNDRFRRFLASMTVVAVIGVSYVGYTVNDTRTKAFDVYLGEDLIGTVRTEEEALQIYSEVEENLSSTYDMGVVLDRELRFEPTNAKDEALTPQRSLRSSIRSQIGVAVTGYELVIEGESLGIFRSPQEVEYILESVKAPFLPHNPVEEEKGEEDKEEVVKPQVHTVRDGDNYWVIAREYGLTVTSLEEANPGVNPSRLKPGDTVNLMAGAEKTTEEKEAAEPILAQDAKIMDVDFIEAVEVVKVEVSYGELSDPEEAIEIIVEGKEEMRTHTVEVGESYWIIARMYDTTVEELEDANPGQNPQSLKPGDAVNLFVPTPLLTVVTVEEVEYTEETAFETEVRNDDSMFKNQKKILVKGEKGLSEIVANEIRHNGIVRDREIIQETVVKEPVTEIVAQGTKELPRTAATGSFMVPTSGRLTSPYGMRSGRMHRGIDLANSRGTNIYAADGGRVTFAGYRGSYGYMVEINHENGYVTRYAHASRLLVKSGDRVYRGQHIADMGSTGRSTGSHLHFEVLLNGVHQNPSRFINR